MEVPKLVKDVQRLEALTRFVSRSTDRSLPFFKILKGIKKFEWTKECEEVFAQLKAYLTQPPWLSKPKIGESLLLYLAVSPTAVSSVLIREEGTTQLLIYYVSYSMVPAETRYPDIEKLALALLVSSRKLKPYFEAHTIVVPTSYPLRQVLHKPETSERLIRWSMELSQYEIRYQPRTAIKGQAVADFVAEFIART